jgi:U3 small nucleolar RNA-associated protein MPP10
MDFVANELYDLSDDSENQESYRYEDFFGRKSSAKKSSSTKSPVRKKLETEDTSDDSREGEGEFEDNEDNFEDEDEDEGSEGSEDGSEDEDEESKENNDEEEEEEESAAYSNQPLTTYAKEKQKLQERIAGIESELVEKKSWERRGEVKGGDRPENSLLGLAVAVERASKSTPIITPEYSKTIEDMIIEKIKASSFSNIVPQRDSVTKTQQGQSFSSSVLWSFLLSTIQQ